MEAFLLLSRLILAAVFSIAGIAKLLDREGSEKAIVNFGVPANLAKSLAVILPIAEIVTAILLLPLQTAWFGAISALILLVAFVGGIVYNLARGEAPDCHCFGQIYSEPVGWSVLIRNLILTAIAAFVIFAGRENAGLSAFAWLNELTTGERMQLVFGLAICGFLTAIFINLRKVLQNQIVLQRQIEVLELTAHVESEGKREIEHEHARQPSVGLPVGAIAPDFAAPDLNGKQIALEHLLMQRKPVLLFFVSPSCNPCKSLLPKIEKWQSEFGAKIKFIFVSSGTPEENKQKFADVLSYATLLLQKERGISDLFRSQWTPGAVLINADGTIGSSLATGDVEIFNLIDGIKPVLASLNGQATANFYLLHKRRQELPIPKPGQLAPDFTLPSLDGRVFSLADFRGRKTVLLFWRATCPHCREIIEELKAWEAEQNEFNLVVLAANEPEIELAREFKSTVLIETDLEVQRKFEIDATPTAILIDEAGKIASDLAQGDKDIFALIGYSPRK